MFVFPPARTNGNKVGSFRAMLCVLRDDEGSIICSVIPWSIQEKKLKMFDELVGCIYDIFLLKLSVV